MRFVLAAVVAIWLPAAAAAQSRSETAAKLPVLPPIGLPLSAIGLPLPSIGLPPVTQLPIVAPSTRPGRGHDGRRGGSGHDGRSRPAVVYLVPAYGWPVGFASAPVAAPAVTASTASAVPVTAVGRLRLDVEADSAVQVFVDGYFAGTLDELNHEIDIEAGLHQIELRAAGYDTQRVDVRITASRTIGYQTAMVPVTPRVAPAATAPAVPRSTIYFIPGCYLGNVPPAEVSLPAGCDLSQLTIRRP